MSAILELLYKSLFGESDVAVRCTLLANTKTPDARTVHIPLKLKVYTQYEPNSNQQV